MLYFLELYREWFCCSCFVCLFLGCSFLRQGFTMLPGQPRTHRALSASVLPLPVNTILFFVCGYVRAHVYRCVQGARRGWQNPSSWSYRYCDLSAVDTGIATQVLSKSVCAFSPAPREQLFFSAIIYDIISVINYFLWLYVAAFLSLSLSSLLPSVINFSFSQFSGWKSISLTLSIL